MHEVQREGNNLFLTTYFWTFDPSSKNFQITAVLKISEKLQVLMINLDF